MIFRVDVMAANDKVVTFLVDAFDITEATNIIGRIKFVNIAELSEGGADKNTETIPEELKEKITEPTAEETEKLNKLFGI